MFRLSESSLTGLPAIQKSDKPPLSLPSIIQGLSPFLPRTGGDGWGGLGPTSHRESQLPLSQDV